MIEKLIIGTANFGQIYNGHQVPTDEIDKIWEYCREVGINIADTAVAYNYSPPKDFKIITKIRDGDIVYLPDYYAVLAHDKSAYPVIECLMECCRVGVSIYTLKDMPRFKVDIVQLPYKACRLGLGKLKKKGVEIHARKVFADDCYKEALLDPNVDGVVIGIDNLAQLKENVKIAKNLEKEK